MNVLPVLFLFLSFFILIYPLDFGVVAAGFLFCPLVFMFPLDSGVFPLGVCFFRLEHYFPLVFGFGRFFLGAVFRWCCGPIY